MLHGEISLENWNVVMVIWHKTFSVLNFCSIFYLMYSCNAIYGRHHWYKSIKGLLWIFFILQSRDFIKVWAVRKLKKIKISTKRLKYKLHILAYAFLMCQWCTFLYLMCHCFVFTSFWHHLSVIYYLTDLQQYGIYL